MTIYLGADHAGFALKEQLKRALAHDKRNVIDLSPAFLEGDDYPVHGLKLAKQIVKTKDSRGILVCGSGTGMAMAANRIKGARAFEAADQKTVRLAREHNDANILTLSGWRSDISAAKKLVDVFLKTKFSGAERHRRRVKQLG